MENQEKGSYVLGTDPSELQRLGFQHQVWASEAHKGWQRANFSYGQTILDLGCGPGFATKELAYLVGSHGKVIAVDKSEQYLHHLNKIIEVHDLTNIQLICSSFEALTLDAESVDCIYHRWALAWMDGVEDIIEKLVQSLKPGGMIVSQEYFDWATLQTFPEIPEWQEAVKAILTSFEVGGGAINIGRQLPKLFEKHGLEIVNIRPIVKMSRPDTLEWNWPATFFRIYLPKVAKMGFISEELSQQILHNISHLESQRKAILLTPTMIEVIAKKPK